MKILEKKRDDLWWVGEEVICLCCGSKFELEHADGYEYISNGVQRPRFDDSIMGKSHWIVDFECPVCGFEMQLRK